MAPFLNVRCVLVEREFIVYCESEVFEAVNRFYCVAFERVGGWDDGVPIVISFALDKLMQVVTCAPFREVCDSVVVIRYRVIV